MIRYLIAGLIGTILGAYLNYRVNQKTNAELLTALKEEFADYLNKQTTTRLTTEDQARMNGLKEAISIIEEKLNT